MTCVDDVNRMAGETSTATTCLHSLVAVYQASGFELINLSAGLSVCPRKTSRTRRAQTGHRTVQAHR